VHARLLGRQANVLVWDGGLALLLLAVEVATLYSVSPRPGDGRWVPQALFDVVGMIAVLLRRRWTWAAVVFIAVHSVLPFAVLPFAVLPVRTVGSVIVVVTYTAAAYLPIRQAIGALLLIWAPAITLAVLAPDTSNGPFKLPTVYFVAFNALSALVCFLVGRTIATRRAYVAALEDRARTSEATQQALTNQAVAEERRRIARELHDVVAHHVSVMGVLATGSRRMLARDPAAADEALATIEETGRTALREMRRLLAVLRADAEPAGELSPQPGLAGVEGLVEQIREAGLSAVLKVEGMPETLDPGVALTVYRIVQEALTNALKHAGEAAVEVRLLFGPQELIVEVCDTGRGPQLRSGAIGHGLLGMRERVMLYGGTLRTGPRPGGGYRVYAKIPLDNAERQLAS
jgi:signal transduction histidine kinase